MEAEKLKFPLFIVVTHWLKEWKELCNEDQENALPAFLDSNGVTELELRFGPGHLLSRNALTNASPESRKSSGGC